MSARICTVFLSPARYPIEGKIGYSTGVSVVRNAPLDPEYRKTIYKIDVITAAAIKDPAVKNNQFVHAEDLEFTRKIIFGILDAARKNEARHLVLGAIGCGVYSNPPKVVASLFAEALEIYANAFDSVTFAILERNQEYLVPIFKQALSK